MGKRCKARLSSPELSDIYQSITVPPSTRVCHPSTRVCHPNGPKPLCLSGHGLTEEHLLTFLGNLPCSVTQVF